MFGLEICTPERREEEMGGSANFNMQGHQEHRHIDQNFMFCELRDSQKVAAHFENRSWCYGKLVQELLGVVTVVAFFFGPSGGGGGAHRVNGRRNG